MDKERILEFVQNKGPCVPLQIAENLKQNSFVVGAALSELVSENKLKVSHAKIGGSRVYYTNGQGAKLTLLYKHLNEKDRRTFDLLKEKKVLNVNDQTPLVRVSLHNIKDFAVRVEVNHAGVKEEFYRWYLLTPEETSHEIKKALHIDQKPPEKPKTQTIEKKPKAPAEKKSEAPIKKHTQKQLSEEPSDDNLHEKTKKFFKEKSIEILQTTVIRKNTEIEYLIEVPTPIGVVQYYCKAKQKKRVNDADIASAFVSGQVKKLPVLFITTGQLTKKAQEKLTTEFHGVKVQVIA